MFNTRRTDQFITEYFNCGLTQVRIMLMLWVINNVQISHPYLGRRLARRRLRRQLQFSDPAIVVIFISDQMNGSGRLYSYRMMHDRFFHVYNQIYSDHHEKSSVFVLTRNNISWSCYRQKIVFSWQQDSWCRYHEKMVGKRKVVVIITGKQGKRRKVDVMMTERQWCYHEKIRGKK